MVSWGIVTGALFLLVDMAGASWQVKRGDATDVNHNTCHIESDPVAMSDGYQSIHAFIRITDKQLGTTASTTRGSSSAENNGERRTSMTFISD